VTVKMPQICHFGNAEVFEHGASLARCSIASGNKRGRRRAPLAVFWRQAPKTVRHEFLQVAKRSGDEGLLSGGWLLCVFVCVGRVRCGKVVFEGIV